MVEGMNKLEEIESRVENWSCGYGDGCSYCATVDKELDAAQEDIAYLIGLVRNLAIGAALKSFAPSRPEKNCRHPHDRVELLARADDSMVGNESGLVWAPICRACGEDVPQGTDVIEGLDNERTLTE